MIYRIYSQDSETLLEKPETGMGYQIVKAKQYNRLVTRSFIIYNSNLAVEIDSNFSVYKRQIIIEGYKTILNNAEELMLETNSITVLSKSKIQENRTVSNFKKKYNNRQSGGKGAADNPKEYADGNEMFVRISAYEDDRRIDMLNRKLKSGTFTTTEKDYRVCFLTIDDPVDRYALPNEESIKWAFYIRPKKIDILQRGIVQPAFGHEGGGIEAFFENGTSKETLLQKREYGK